MFNKTWTSLKKLHTKHNNTIWLANRPISQSETELLGAQLNEVRTKELCSQLGTIHVWPQSTASQTDGIGWESILVREENQSAQRKTFGVRLRLTETQTRYVQT